MPCIAAAAVVVVLHLDDQTCSHLAVNSSGVAFITVRCANIGVSVLFFVTFYKSTNYFIKGTKCTSLFDVEQAHTFIKLRSAHDIFSLFALFMFCLQGCTKIYCQGHDYRLASVVVYYTSLSMGLQYLAPFNNATLARLQQAPVSGVELILFELFYENLGSV